MHGRIAAGAGAETRAGAGVGVGAEIGGMEKGMREGTRRRRDLRPSRRRRASATAPPSGAAATEMWTALIPSVRTLDEAEMGVLVVTATWGGIGESRSWIIIFQGDK